MEKLKIASSLRMSPRSVLYGKETVCKGTQDNRERGKTESELMAHASGQLALG